MIALALALQMAVTAPAQTDTAFRTLAPSRPRTLAIQEGDAWLGADKFKHAGMSYAITAFSFAATDSEEAAIASGAVAGILKEVMDRRRGSLFSVRDLIWDAAGIALGYAVIKQTR